MTRKCKDLRKESMKRKEKRKKKEKAFTCRLVKIAQGCEIVSGFKNRATTGKLDKREIHSMKHTDCAEVASSSRQHLA